MTVEDGAETSRAARQPYRSDCTRFTRSKREEWKVESTGGPYLVSWGLGGAA